MKQINQLSGAAEYSPHLPGRLLMKCVQVKNIKLNCYGAAAATLAVCVCDCACVCVAVTAYTFAIDYQHNCCCCCTHVLACVG